jgi:hypothetical protein
MQLFRWKLFQRIGPHLLAKCSVSRRFCSLRQRGRDTFVPLGDMGFGTEVACGADISQAVAGHDEQWHIELPRRLTVWSSVARRLQSISGKR